MPSLGGGSVPEMVTPLFSLSSNWKYVLGLPRWLSDKRICLPMQEMQEKWVQSLGWEDFLEEKIATQSSYSCLDNPMDRRAWWATVHGVRKSQTQLSNWVSESIPSGHYWSHQQKGHLTAMTRRHNPACAVKDCYVLRFSFRSYCLTASGSLGDIFILMTFAS